MTRRHLTFACEGATLFGTLDEAASRAGLLVISGGSEIRSGAFSGQAHVAAALAARGFPIFRFDRRGVGDSSGDNAGFRSSAPDFAAALEAFRQACPSVERIVAFGNCDAASALMLGDGAGAAALVLANPWTFEDEQDDSLPPDAIRSRYAAKLRNPREWLRLLRGGVDLRKLARGLRAAAAPAPAASGLLAEMQAGLAAFPGPVRILLAGRDRTAQAFAACWPKDDARVSHRSGADHAFSAPEDRDWLVEQLCTALHEQARQLDMG